MAGPFKPHWFTEITIEELTTPKSNHKLILDHYWIIGPNGHPLIYTRMGSYTPQCNPSKEIADKVVYEGCTIQFIDYAYVEIKY